MSFLCNFSQPLIEKDKLHILEIQSELERKLAERKEEAERQELVLSSLKVKMEEQQWKICEVR